MRNFQVLLLVFAVVIATNIHIQAKPQLGDSDKSPVVKSKQQSKPCSCVGRRNALEQDNCTCERQRQHGTLSEEQRTCQKKKYRKCPRLNRGNKKEEKGISMPI
ncbi:uncharacterized protein zgc:158701 [Carassius gibelio]|uniref:uncharacterized protein zgc:158701 n=1 Tax=Carassius gibelio TaxID=101364 RepID=UPI002278BC4A|nr:uncharacterized protein zgc:158701 [Carassius gibelio]